MQHPVSKLAPSPIQVWSLAPVLIALSTLAVGQVYQAPPCVATCYNTTVSNGTLAPEAVTIPALCSTLAFSQALTDCVLKGCNTTDITAGLPVLEEICAGLGASLVTNGLTGIVTSYLATISSISISSISRSIQLSTPVVSGTSSVNGSRATASHSSSTSTPASGGSSVHSRSNTGAIAGGVVGGVVLVGLIAFILFLLMRKRRNLSAREREGENINEVWKEGHNIQLP
ncbi:hypothetical protein T439DRAFT_49186 [Meredithblackwellia eburnea MCA 4105]